MQRKYWTKEEVTKLIEIYPYCGIHELMIFFQCSAAQIWKKANMMHLTKHNKYLSDIRKKTALVNIKKANTKKCREKSIESIREMIRKERLRIKYGLKQKSKRRFAPYEHPQKYAHWKYKLRKHGYITHRFSLEVFYNAHTKRSEKTEQHLCNKGFIFKKENED